MANVKRRVRRQKKPGGLMRIGLRVDAWCEEGELTVAISWGRWVGFTGVLNTGIPDCDLPLLGKKIADRMKGMAIDDLDDILSVADEVIEEEKPGLMALAKKQSPGGSPGS